VRFDQVVATAWWLFFWTALGLCVGSFLNVVLYRVPRGLSIRSPLWSMCPFCRRRIAWYDNIPLLSFAVLGGRCRQCRMPIATRYVVVEAVSAVLVLVLLDVFFVGHLRAGLCAARFGLTDQLAFDWPIFTAHVILFLGLFSMSVIDVEHYWVDIRVTHLATAAGFALHMLWTPRHSAAWPRPAEPTAVVALLAVLGLAATWVVVVCQPHADPEDFGLPAGEAEPVVGGAGSSEAGTVPRRDLAALYESPPRAAGWLAVMLLGALLGVVFTSALGRDPVRPWLRAFVPLAFLFGWIVRASAVHRESDVQIVEAIQEERHGARRAVLAELGLLLPAMALGLTGLLVVWWSPEARERLGEMLHSQPRVWGVSLFRNWEPLWGLATAASGYVLAGALGWAVRIGFTLLLGKEAFGVGDIHLMATAGAIAGWPVAVIGFAVACALALLGWVLTLPFKVSRAVPLGPWLALSFLVVVIYYEWLVQTPLLSRAREVARMLIVTISQP